MRFKILWIILALLYCGISSNFHNSRFYQYGVNANASWRKLERFNLKSNPNPSKRLPYEKLSIQETRSPCGDGASDLSRKVWKQPEQEKCNGYENFIHDLEILSLKLTLVGFAKASVAWLLHVLNQFYGFVSVYIIGGKERFSFFANAISPETIPEEIEKLFAWIGFFDYLFTRVVSYPVGNLILIIDTLSLILGFISIVFDAITTFNEIFKWMVLGLTGIDLDKFFMNYGCYKVN